MSTKQQAALLAPVNTMATGLGTLPAAERPLSVDASASQYIGLILQQVDVLPVLFRCLDATQWRVEELCSLMPVCKQWCSELKRVVVDWQWLKPLRIYSALFVAEIPLLVDSITSSDWELHSYNTRLGNIKKFYGKMRATMWDVSTQIKALEGMAQILHNVLMHNYGNRALCMIRTVMNMQTHSALIQKESCCAIASMAFNFDNAPSRDAQGGLIPRIVQVLCRFGGDTETANHAVVALYNIMDVHPINRGLVVEAGAVPLVLRMMRLHSILPDQHFFPVKNGIEGYWRPCEG